MKYRVKFAILLILLVSVTACSKKEQKAPAQTFEQAAQDFVKLLADNDFKAAVKQFDNTMKNALPSGKLKEVWQQIQRQVGAFNSQLSTRQEKYMQYQIVFVTCQFANGQLDTKVVFNKQKKVSGLFFVPVQKKNLRNDEAGNSPKASAPPYASKRSFTESDITVGTKEFPLPATLSLPKGKGPFPAIILVHGSGPNDRDETNGPNKPFRDLAWGLASRGVAVLRYEKRTKHHAEKLIAMAIKMTVFEESIEDAVGAVSMLKQNNLVQGEKIYILGHSLGGMLVPKIAGHDKAKQIAGFVVLAGNSRPLTELLPEQYHYIFSLDNTITKEEKQMLTKIKRQSHLAGSLELSNETPAKDLPFGVPAAYWMSLRGYQPAQDAAKMTRPMLILQGERDYQVTMTDYLGWKEALAHRMNVSFKSFPGLNHLFMIGKGKSTPTEYGEAGHVALEVIDIIAGWIKKQ
jgi:uncharacterized protein